VRGGQVTDTLALAYARARVCGEMRRATSRYCDASSDHERDIAEQEFRDAAARLAALPGLIPPDRLAALISSPAWMGKDVTP
jgi:hypothetical protein